MAASSKGYLIVQFFRGITFWLNFVPVLLVLRFAAQTQILGAALGFPDPSAQPILAAVDVDAAGIIAIIGVLFVVVPKQRAAIRFLLECHSFFLLLLAQDDRLGRRAEAPGHVDDEVQRG